MSEINQIAELLQNLIKSRQVLAVGTAQSAAVPGSPGLYETSSGTIRAISTNFCYGNCLLAKVEGAWYAINPADNRTVIRSNVDRLIMNKNQPIDTRSIAWINTSGFNNVIDFDGTLMDILNPNHPRNLDNNTRAGDRSAFFGSDLSIPANESMGSFSTVEISVLTTATSENYLLRIVGATIILQTLERLILQYNDEASLYDFEINIFYPSISISVIPLPKTTDDLKTLDFKLVAFSGGDIGNDFQRFLV